MLLGACILGISGLIDLVMGEIRVACRHGEEWLVHRRWCTGAFIFKGNA